jgi:hypothetical protein
MSIPFIEYFTEVALPAGTANLVKETALGQYATHLRLREVRKLKAWLREYFVCV